MVQKDVEKLLTYKSGGSKTTIDYILVGKEEKVKKNVIAIPGEEVMMQHRLVVMDILFRKVQHVHAVRQAR